jgi:hypothetical protein
MPTEPPIKRKTITQPNLPTIPDEDEPIPPARKPTRYTIAIVMMLIVTAVVALVVGSSQPPFSSEASNQSLTWTQNQPNPVSAPVCPVMRPDPTFGVSLIDTQTGQPLCERNAQGVAQPASTTKVMSALLVEEYLRAHNLNLTTNITVQTVDTQVEGDAAVAHLVVGQAYSVHLLLEMVSIKSAADATMVLARFVAGSRSAFLALMNQRAQALGMLHTHYTSPYGYEKTSADNWQKGENTSIGNFSTAHDMATLMLEFARYPDLVSIFNVTAYHEGDTQLYRGPIHNLPDSWIGLQTPNDAADNDVQNLHLPFQVLASKKGCMWCENAIHKISYVLLVRFQQQIIVAAFLYTTQDYFDPMVGDMLPTLLWAFHQCTIPAYKAYCNLPAPTPTPGPTPTP